MCRVFSKLRKEGKTEQTHPTEFPNHKSASGYTGSTFLGPGVERRIAERKAFNEAKKLEIPAYWANNDVRRARIKLLRERMGMTQIEFAHMLGTSLAYYEKIEWGQRTCAMVYLKLVEKKYAYFRLREYRKKQAEKKRMRRVLKLPPL